MFNNNIWIIGAVLLFASVYFQETRCIRLKLSLLNANQKSALKEFRATVVNDDLPKDYMKEDSYLLRFLSAKNFNVLDAKNFLQENLQLRKDENIDSVLEEDWSQFEKRYPVQWTINKEDRPVLYYHYGAWDIAKEMECKNYDALFAYTTAKLSEEAERKLQAQKKTSNDNDINQHDVIVNLAGCETNLACIRCHTAQADVLQRLEVLYPEAADNIIFINAPTEFKETFDVAAHLFFNEHTMKSLKILGGPEEFESVLLQLINKDKMPTILK